MNRKLILGGLVLGGLVGAAASCSVTQRNEGCAIESGGVYQAKYTITTMTGNCGLFQTHDLEGNVIKDSQGHLLAAEEISVQEYGVAGGTLTVQETPDLFALNGGTNAIGTLGPWNPNYCQETAISAATVAIPDPSFGMAPLPATPPVDGGNDTCVTCTQDSDCTSGHCNVSAGTPGLCDVSLGSACDGGTCTANGGTCATVTTADGGSQDACTCAVPSVQVTYSFSDIQFEQAYSILGKQFHGQLQYDQVPVTPAYGGSECHASITVDAVQYHDNAHGTPGHLQGDHCELDANGSTADCDQHAGTYGFPASTGWMCMPMLDQANFTSETYADGGKALPLPDGGAGPIPGQRCVPAIPVPIGAAND